MNTSRVRVAWPPHGSERNSVRILSGFVESPVVRTPPQVGAFFFHRASRRSLPSEGHHTPPREREPAKNSSVAQLTVAPDANRCFTVLRVPDFIASPSAPVNCRPLGVGRAALLCGN